MSRHARALLRQHKRMASALSLREHDFIARICGPAQPGFLTGSLCVLRNILSKRPVSSRWLHSARDAFPAWVLTRFSEVWIGYVELGHHQ